MMAHQDLDEVIRRIDGAFGAGYAKAHPELVAARVRAAAFDCVAQVIEEHPASGDLVRKALLTELRELSEAMGESLDEKPLDDRNA